jgi:glycosyltransferase involved in cell wall biosynthesis
MSPEKGIRTLLSAWITGKIPLGLRIIGDGPLAEEVRSRAACMAGVEYLGAQPPEKVYREMARAKFLVFPSEWFETFGRTIIEAFSQGTPVLACDLGCVRELVEDGVTGYRFAPGNAESLIAGVLRFLACDDYDRMRVNCRNLFLDKFTAEINYTLLTEIYAKAIARRKLRQRSS